MYKYENFIGKVLDGRYKILELVGLGGMAFVLKAEDLVMNRIVAIKILNDEFNGNEQAEARFINESKAVAMLSHKNIVSIYDVAIYPDMKYIVMEFLDGITLREYLDNKGALPWKEACVYILQILRALEHAHSKSVIHRDIKPQNIMLEKNGEIKVTDFGIAKLPNAPSLTLTEKAIGTVYYISPEQASGKETNFYSDIYAVGVMMYEAVTGQLPFTADSPLSIAMKQINQKPRNPADLVKTLPVGVCQIILKAMEKDPYARFSSAHTMCKAIEWVLRNPDVVFLIGGSNDETAKSNPAAVSIDMIDTSEIQNYGDNEIAETLGKNIKRQPNDRKVKGKKVNEAKNKKQVKKSRSFFPIIMGVAIPLLLVALVLGGIVLYKVIFPGPAEDKTVTYPDLINLEWNSELKAKLNNGTFGANFKIKKVEYVENDDFASGRIISTDPPGGHISKSASDSSNKYFNYDVITVCRKLEDVTVPDVTYLTRTAAMVLLQGDMYKLDVITETESSNNFFENQVTRTVPEAGSLVRAGDPITVYICARPVSNDTAPMPNLVGSTVSIATEKVQYTLYKYTLVPVENADGNNTVISQDVPPGTVSPSGTTVTITYSVKPDGNSMPDITGSNKTDALNQLNALGITINDFRAYYIESGDGTLEMLVSGYEYAEAIEIVNNSPFMESHKLTDETIVVYQSIPVGTKIGPDTEIYIIYGVPIEWEEPNY
ncbi:MAG: protein kinase [Eubacteriales bacterium]|nr:protein kinase [Eubacteriales bacterium]MDD4421604.1 protein kinase [Eubacteriales bacterium]